MLILLLWSAGLPAIQAADSDDLPRAARKALYAAQQAIKKQAYREAQTILLQYMMDHPDEAHPLVFYALGNDIYRVLMTSVFKRSSGTNE